MRILWQGVWQLLFMFYFSNFKIKCHGNSSILSYLICNKRDKSNFCAMCAILIRNTNHFSGPLFIHLLKLKAFSVPEKLAVLCHQFTSAQGFISEEKGVFGL